MILTSLFGFSQTIYETEKVFLHTDRDLYAPGDTLRFRAFVFNGNSNILSTKSGVVYALIMAAEKFNTTNTKVKIENGLGEGFLVLPANTLDGYYSLTAYTELMRNLPEKYFFQKTIELSKARLYRKNLKPKAKEYVPKISFYPEGGTLVSGISTKIGFKIDLPDTLKKHFDGRILNKEGKLVSSFFPDFNGVGSFFFEPEPNQEYSVAVKIKSTTHKADFPKIQDLGYVISTDNVVYADGIMINVHTNKNDSENLRIMAHQSGNILFNFSFKAENSVYKFPLSDKLFERSGVVEVVLFNELNEKLCNRLVYQHVENKNNLLINNKTSPSGKNDLKISISSEKELNSLLSISVAEYPGRNLLNPKLENLEHYLLFYNDFGNKMPLVDSLFKLKSTVSKFYIDNLMLTQTWGKPSVYSPEKNQFDAEKTLAIRGFLRSGSDIVKNQLVSIFVNDSFGNLYFTVKTDSRGMFSLVGDWTDSVKVFARDLMDNKLTIAFEDFYVPSLESEIELAKKPIVKQGILENKILSSKTINLNEVIVSGKGGVDLKNDYRRRLYNWEPDEEISLDSSAVNVGISTILEQNIPEIPDGEISLKKYEYLFKNQQVAINNKTNVLQVMVDSRRVPIEFLQVYKGADLTKIDVVRTASKIKEIDTKNIILINLLTKKGRDLNVIFNENEAISWKGYVTEKPFSNKTKTLPAPVNPLKKRQLVYWNILNTDKDGKVGFTFNKSDAFRPYKVTVFGVSKSEGVFSKSYIVK